MIHNVKKSGGRGEGSDGLRPKRRKMDNKKREREREKGDS